jgi:CRP-like cAMP-binding protein
MAEFVDSTVRDIDTRLEALRDEVSRLEAARSALLGGATSAGARAATRARRNGTRRSTRSARPRAERGTTRANQALELVRSRPGITIPEIAKELGIEPNYLYRVMPKLVDQGQVTRQGQGWFPSSTAAAN